VRIYETRTSMFYTISACILSIILAIEYDSVIGFFNQTLSNRIGLSILFLALIVLLFLLIKSLIYESRNYLQLAEDGIYEFRHGRPSLHTWDNIERAIVSKNITSSRITLLLKEPNGMLRSFIIPYSIKTREHLNKYVRVIQ
jgi:hypothetical protein